MEFLDLHTHIYPEDIARKATESVRAFYGIGAGDQTGTAEDLLTRGARAGIRRFVILPVAIRPDRVTGINDFILRQVRSHREFLGFGTVHAAMAAIGEETERVLSMGLRGIKLHPDSQRFSIDDPRLFPMYEALRGRAPVLLHMGDLRYDFSQPARLRRVLDLFPGLQAIAAHFGGYRMYEEARQALGDRDCVFDTSSSLMFLPEGEAERYIGLYGAERMAFGTDYPMWDPEKEMERFLRLKLKPEQLEQIASKTACRILNLPEK